MQETVTNTNERKSLFSSFLEVLESREKQAQVDRQLQEEKYLRRTQRIYDFHERQRVSAAELRRCVEYVTAHAGTLEAALRGGEVPLGAALARQAAALQRCMAQCVANAARIRHLLAATHHPQMDTLLAKMEAELSSWSAFLLRAVDASRGSEAVLDNLHNIIAEQRRCVREVAASNVYTALTGGAGGEAGGAGGEAGGAGGEAGGAGGEAGGAGGEAGGEVGAGGSPAARAAPTAACSTPLARE